MCHGHPKHHRCSHTSVSWYYCTAAYFDMETGAVSPCGNPVMNESQPTKSACPLQHCSFSSKGSSWQCCQCHQGPNTQGWCTQRLTPQQVGIDPSGACELQMTCDHGCCKSCTPLGSGSKGTGEASWSGSYYSYGGAGSPSSSSDSANTWLSSPASSQASSDSGSDRGNGKTSSRSKKHSSKSSSSKRR